MCTRRGGLVAAWILGLFAALPALAGPDADFWPVVQLAAHAVAPHRAGQIELAVPTAAGSLVLELEPAATLEDRAARFVAAVRRGHTRVYRGHVRGDAASWARLTRIGTGWAGLIVTGGGAWALDPATDAAGIDATRVTPLAAPLVDLPRGPDTVSIPPAWRPSMQHAGRGAADVAPPALSLRLSVVLDTDFQQRLGGDAESVAVGIVNILDGIFQAALNMTVSLQTLQLLPPDNAMQSTQTYDLLEQFGTYVKSGALPFDGLAQLLTGKRLQGGVGMALLGGNIVCNRNLGISVASWVSTVASTASEAAHEIGHNFGANHDGQQNSCPLVGYIMSPYVSSLNPPTEFSTCSLGDIHAYLDANAHACLLRPDAIFANGFE